MYCTQGAGGNGNVLKELVEPLGAVIALRRIPRGDLSLSAREIWGAEYQENDACLVRGMLVSSFHHVFGAVIHTSLIVGLPPHVHDLIVYLDASPIKVIDCSL